MSQRTSLEIDRKGRVATVRFDRGDDLNALSARLMNQLLEAARSFEDDNETSVIVLTGSRERFSAGIDLRDPELLSSMQAPLGDRRQGLRLGPRMCRAWEALDQFTIAAVEGHCIGGGVSLALSCDFRVAATDAFFRLPEIGLGMNMSWGTIPRLIHLVGPARTKQIVITAEKIGARQAADWGLVQELAKPGESVDLAMKMADKVAQMPPLSVKMTKQTVNAITNALDHAASYMETDQFMLCQMTEDHSEAVSAFLGKTKPDFKGR